MTRANLALWAVGAIALSGCVITSGDDDGASATEGSSASQTGQPSSGSATTTTTASTTSTTDDTDAGTTTVGPMGDCTENLVVDPGFEAGTPNSSWAETSEIFGTPICDQECTMDSGAAPHGGTWWVWFGGIEEPDQASVSQAISIPPETAYLSFYFEINAAQGEVGNDVMLVEIDGTEVFMASDAELDVYPSYTLVQIEISEFADGGPHTLTIRAEMSGSGLSNFFIDDVSLVSCGPPAGSTGSSGSTDGSSGTDGTGSSGTSDGSTGTSDGSSSTGSTGTTTGA
jgi:hypothetical protein